MENYEFLTEEDLAFIRPENRADKAAKAKTLQDSLKELSKKLITYGKDKSLTYGEALAAKFYRECFEHPTAKNIETFAKLTGEFKENIDVSVNPANELFSCLADDNSK